MTNITQNACFHRYIAALMDNSMLLWKCVFFCFFLQQ